MPNEEPLTALNIARKLGRLSEELDVLVKKIGDDDRIATVCREEYLRAYAKAWRAAVGSVEARKQIAMALTSDERLAAEIADCEVRDQRRKIDALKVRIEVGRSLGVAVRAEASLVQSPFSPYGS